MAEIVDYKKWRSAWLVINPDKSSRYIIEHYYRKLKEKAIPFEVKKDIGLRMFSITFCLNGRIIDASKQLVYKELGADQDYQSVLNDQC